AHGASGVLIAMPAVAPVTDARVRAPVRERRILLATDLGEASQAATDQAFDLAASLGARLVAISVIDPGSLLLPGGRFRARIDQVRERLERDAQALVARGRQRGIDVTFLVWAGDPGGP